MDKNKHATYMQVPRLRIQGYYCQSCWVAFKRIAIPALCKRINTLKIKVREENKK